MVGCGLRQPTNMSAPACAVNPKRNLTVYVEPYHVKDNIGIITYEWDRDKFIKQVLTEKLNVTFVESPAQAQIVIKTISVTLAKGLSHARVKSQTLVNNDTLTLTAFRPEQFALARSDRESLLYGNGDAELLTDMIMCNINGSRITEAEGVIKVSDGIKYEWIGNIELK